MRKSRRIPFFANGLAIGLAAACGSALVPLQASQAVEILDPGLVPHNTPTLPSLVSKTIQIGTPSGLVAHNGAGSAQPKVVWSKTVTAPGAAWLRVYFKDVALASGADVSTGSYIRITNLREKAVQFLNTKSLKEWSNSSCYFNGDSLLVEVIAHPGTGPSQLTIDHVDAGDPSPAGGMASICGPTDDRVLSDDVRVGRLMPQGCTGFLIDDANHMFLSAGHCSAGTGDVMQFNCPLSTAGGTPVAPPPDDQYPVDGTSVQFQNAGPGNDWAYFGCFANSNTGLTAYQAQGDFFNTIAAPAPANQNTRETGYGIVSSPVSPTWNQAQKTHTGPYTAKTNFQVKYQIDDTGGNSGSPLFLVSNHDAYAIDTHAGCTNPPGNSFNSATDIGHTNLQNALNNPLGVCDSSIADPTGPLYFVGDTLGNFGTINRETGLFGTVGPLGESASQGLAYDRVNDKFYSTSGTSFFTINRSTGDATKIADFVGDSIWGLGYDPNTATLYGYATNTQRLYRINVNSGALTAVGSPVTGRSINGLDFDPVTNTLYGVDDAGGASQLVKVNTTTGAVTDVGTGIGVGATDCDALACSPDDGYLYTVDQGLNTLIRIDPVTGAGAIIGVLDQETFDGGMAAVCGDCPAPTRVGPVSPANGAVNVDPSSVQFTWIDPTAEYCGQAGANASVSFSDANPFRGNVLEIFSGTTLTKLEAKMDFVGAQPITWTVYEFEDDSGNGTLIYNKTQSITGTGNKYYSSGPIGVPLKPGHVYAIGWHHVGGGITYFRDNVPTPNTGGYGNFLGGFAQNLAALPATTPFTGFVDDTQYSINYCLDPTCFNPAPDADQSFNSQPIIRGNIVRMDQTKMLTELEADLNFVGVQPFSFVVYEGGDVNTPGTLIYQKSMSLNGTGRKLYSSGAINVELQADRTYAIGYLVADPDITYHLRGGVLPIDFQYGVVKSAVQATPAGAVPPASINLAGNSSAYGVNMCFGPVKDQLNMSELDEDSGGTTANLLRGNIVHCEKDSVLNEIQMRLQFATQQQVTFVVYESTTLGGNGNLIYSKSSTFNANPEAWYSTGAINVPMLAGRYYAIGVHKPSADITYSSRTAMTSRTSTASASRWAASPRRFRACPPRSRSLP